MNVHEAVTADIKSIVDFQVKMAAETEGIQLNNSILLKGVTSVVGDTSKGRYYIADLNGTVIVSLLTTYELSDWHNGTALWIQSVFLLPEYRRRGVYRCMYSHIKQLVTNNHDLKGIRLYADKSNHIAHKTYKELGMSPDHYVTFEWLKEN